ncbi:MAG: hypothetical protein ABSE46_19365 [Terracidiphilus sp.]|jgi:phenylpropionate dioxygenase-like ring-hydroxylating dioxygenase large terminal subunit
MPGDPPIGGRKFQTNPLYRVLGHFTINKNGRLIYHFVHYKSQEGKGPLPFMRAIPTGDIDLDFHGDIKLTPDDDENAQQYVVRFRHRTVECVRIFGNPSEAEQMLAVRRNLEDSRKLHGVTTPAVLQLLRDKPDYRVLLASEIRNRSLTASLNFCLHPMYRSVVWTEA